MTARTPQERMETGRQANDILASEVYRQAVVAARADVVSRLADAPAAELVEIRAEIRAIDKVEDQLRRFVADGQFAAKGR